MVRAVTDDDYESMLLAHSLRAAKARQIALTLGIGFGALVLTVALGAMLSSTTDCERRGGRAVESYWLGVPECVEPRR